MVCVAADENGACAIPSAASAIDGSYPIARPLRMYTNGDSKGPVKTYLDWIMSEAGQCILQEKGYAPIEEISCP
jgi:phosphate transport system substrate-binding protein